MTLRPVEGKYRGSGVRYGVTVNTVRGQTKVGGGQDNTGDETVVRFGEWRRRLPHDRRVVREWGRGGGPSCRLRLLHPSSRIQTCQLSSDTQTLGLSFPSWTTYSPSTSPVSSLKTVPRFSFPTFYSKHP